VEFASKRRKHKSEMSREGREGYEEKGGQLWKNFAVFARPWLNFQLSTGNLPPLD
jgi:hypothetical protein